MENCIFSEEEGKKESSKYHLDASNKCPVIKLTPSCEALYGTYLT